jgi:hypothetical protein
MKTVMIKSNSNIPIFRRLLLTFAIAAAVPAFVIIFLGNFYLTSLATRGQAVQTSFDAQSIASAQETNLQVMNALMKASLNNIFAGQSASVHDPSLVASGGLIFSDLTARETDFDHTLATYQSDYEVATSNNMSTIRTILLNDNPTTGPIIINDQQQALSESTKQWHLYRQFQDTIINQLAPLENDLLQGITLSLAQLNRAYELIYPTYYQANIHFTDLQNSWQRVANDAVGMGKTVAAVGPSQTTPVYILSIIFTCTILLIFAIVWGFTSFQLKKSYSLYSEGKHSGNTPVPPSGSIPPVPQLP